MPNLFKRLKNLWKLSEFEPATDEDNKFGSNSPGTTFSMLKRKPQMAQIIKKQSPIDEFINHN